MNARPDIAVPQAVPTSNPECTALLVPGQGSQTAEMAEVVAAERPDLLNLARGELGVDPFETLDEGTRFAQPAIYCASLAYWERAGRPEHAMVAGHSLGELGALAIAGSLGEEDGLHLALLRGRLMEAAGEASPGSMMAVLGGGDRQVYAIAERYELAVANDNAPGQVVLSGPIPALKIAKRELRDAGIKALRLPVSGAFHSAAMAAAGRRLRDALAEVEFRRAGALVYSSTTAEPFRDPRAELAAALTAPVRWRQTIARMHSDGARAFVEVGPGDVLTGLVRRTLEDVESYSLATQEALHA